MASNLKHLLLAHLRSNHTVGLPDVIFTPWVLERDQPLDLYGPVGSQRMVDHLLAALDEDVRLRIDGLEPANELGYRVNVQEIREHVPSSWCCTISSSGVPPKPSCWRKSAPGTRVRSSRRETWTCSRLKTDGRASEPDVPSGSLTEVFPRPDNHRLSVARISRWSSPGEWS